MNRDLGRHCLHARIQKVLSEGSDFDNVFLFLVDEGSKEYIEVRGGRIQIAE